MDPDHCFYYLPCESKFLVKDTRIRVNGTGNEQWNSAKEAFDSQGIFPLQPTYDFTK
jgi:hypothetical protein